MPPVCEGCGRNLGDNTVKFCPTCGRPTGLVPEAGDPSSPPHERSYHQRSARGAVPGPMGAYPYPQPPPYPMYYKPPMNAQRGSSVAGGVFMVIDGILAFLFGLPLLFFLSSPVGAYLMVTFILAMVGATAVFRCESLHLAPLGGLALVAGGIFVMFVDNDFIIIGLIGLVLAAISLGLIWAGWKDMMMRQESRKRPMPHPMAGQPYPVATAPPGYGPETQVRLNVKK